MRRLFLIGIAACSLVLGAAPAAQASNPDGRRISFSGTDTDTDFCGTGETVHISFTVSGREFLSPNGGAEYVNVSHGTVTFTSETATVINHFAGRFTDVIVSGDPEGIHVHEFTNIGLPEQLRLEHGGVITLDAGSITFRDTFNGDQFLSEEVIFNGPHPEAESNFELFCDVIPGALGL